ncbi:MAG: signal recognition particle-docking protein FtsY [Actinomycetales bacterium]|jgi:fused signal recognition particle receptor|nr:signal recognition particle-docking protein FtsY [Actinomycetales bacterium]
MGIFGSLFSKFSKTRATPEELQDFRSALISSDIGPRFTDELIELVGKKSGNLLAEDIREQISASLTKSPRDITLVKGELSTILIVGVNGTGKTTSAAKLAAHFKTQGLSVMLAAADTFRAAAVEQLQTWGTRIGAPVISGKAGADPAAVAFDAATQAKENRADVLIIDTAGRLHTKSNLMDELGKVKRVVEKVTPINEVLFVLDGTTGQNGIAQARTFAESIALSGIIVTKVDGSTRGGIALATERELKIPIKFVGTGEGSADLAPFEPDSYIQALFT